jgi:hypothetical protein
MREASDAINRLYEEGHAALTTPGRNRETPPQSSGLPNEPTPPPATSESVNQLQKVEASTPTAT